VGFRVQYGTRKHKRNMVARGVGWFKYGGGDHTTTAHGTLDSTDLNKSVHPHATSREVGVVARKKRHTNGYTCEGRADHGEGQATGWRAERTLNKEQRTRDKEEGKGMKREGEELEKGRMT